MAAMARKFAARSRGGEHQEDRQGHGNGLAPRCARRRTACAPRVPMPRRSATSRPTCRKGEPRVRHPFMQQRRQGGRSDCIVVTTDKGLCGGMNTNVLRGDEPSCASCSRRASGARPWPSATRAWVFLNRIGAKMVSHAVQLGDTPHLDKLVGPVKVLLDAYAAGEKRRLPVPTRVHQHDEAGTGGRAGAAAVGRRCWAAAGAVAHAGTTSTNPDAPAVIDELLLRYVEALVLSGGREHGLRAVGPRAWWP